MNSFNDFMPIPATRRVSFGPHILENIGKIEIEFVRGAADPNDPSEWGRYTVIAHHCDSLEILTIRGRNVSLMPVPFDGRINEFSSTEDGINRIDAMRAVVKEFDRVCAEIEGKGYKIQQVLPLP